MPTTTIQADRASAKFRRHLAILLAFDAKNDRHRSPVSLPGRIAPADHPPPPEITPPAAPPPRTHGPAHLDRCSSVLAMRAPTDADGFGPYRLGELMQMNARFAARLERAFAAGDENIASASAAVRVDAKTDRVLG